MQFRYDYMGKEDKNKYVMRCITRIPKRAAFLGPVEKAGCRMCMQDMCGLLTGLAPNHHARLTFITGWQLPLHHNIIPRSSSNHVSEFKDGVDELYLNAADQNQGG
jgi:hypothetical protein